MIYLDNAATSFPKPKGVLQKANDFYSEFGGNALRGQHEMALNSSKLIEKTRKQVSKILGLKNNQNVVFSPSATVALNQVIFGLEIPRGSVVYLSPFEHNSVLRPIYYLAKKKDLEIKFIPFDKTTFEVDWDSLKEKFSLYPPDNFFITQVSNVCGFELPIDEIIKFSKEYNEELITIVDAAQAAGLYPVPESADFYVFSGHKTLFGPYGIAGIVFLSEKDLQPYLFGGTGTNSEDIKMPEEGPARFEVGSQNVWAIAGLSAALEWLEVVTPQKVLSEVKNFTQMIGREIEGLKGCELYGKQKNSSLLSINFKENQPQKVEQILSSKGIIVRSGLHCAPKAHEFLGTLEIGGTIRVSPGFFNKLEDIEFLITQLKKMQG